MIIDTFGPIRFGMTKKHQPAHQVPLARISSVAEDSAEVQSAQAPERKRLLARLTGRQFKVWPQLAMHEAFGKDNPLRGVTARVITLTQ